MRRVLLKVFLIFLWVWVAGTLGAHAQSLLVSSDNATSMALQTGGIPPSPAIFLVDSGSVLSVPAILPRMAPDLALQVCHGRSVVQAANLIAYSAITVVRAELPDTSQSGEYELQTQYSAPHTLTFKPLRFTGDSFVKSNVIVRVLQSEVDHVQKDDPSLNAITPANYKFSYKGTSRIAGREVHIYQLKPRHKRLGLFKGRIYLDTYTGSLVRAEGRLAKSPSLFIKKIEFVQDYADLGDFTFPVHMHSEAEARIVGRTVVDIYQSDYQPTARIERASIAAAPMP
jgi:hypothetical protein